MHHIFWYTIVHKNITFLKTFTCLFSIFFYCWGPHCLTSLCLLIFWQFRLALAIGPIEYPSVLPYFEYQRDLIFIPILNVRNISLITYIIQLCWFRVILLFLELLFLLIWSIVSICCFCHFLYIYNNDFHGFFTFLDKWWKNHRKYMFVWLFRPPGRELLPHWGWGWGGGVNRDHYLFHPSRNIWCLMIFEWFTDELFNFFTRIIEIHQKN